MMIRVLVIVLVMSGFAYAEDYAELKQRADDYWRQIQKITAKEFGGWNAEVKIHTAYNFESSESSSTGKGIGIGLSMPIYSKQQKIASRLAARDFSEHGSKLVREYKESIAHGEITADECRYKQSIMSEYGVAAVDSYFECKRKLASQKLIMEEKERNISSLLDPYLKNPEIQNASYIGGQ